MKAFPSTEPIYNCDVEVIGLKQSTGMDLRDYFAAKAMQELLRWDLNVDVEEQQGWAWVGEYSYRIADFMMKAREKHD